MPRTRKGPLAHFQQQGGIIRTHDGRCAVQTGSKSSSSRKIDVEDLAAEAEDLYAVTVVVQHQHRLAQGVSRCEGIEAGVDELEASLGSNQFV